VSAAHLRYCGRHARHYRMAMFRVSCFLTACQADAVEVFL